MAKQFSGHRVAGLVAVMIVLTAVIPPAAAFTLARWRIGRAASLAESGAAALTSRKQALRASVGEMDVVYGPGRLPRAAVPAADWVRNPVSAHATFADIWPQDPWGRCYLLDVRALFTSGSGLLISAGPNGEIDTPLGAAVPAGDDIAATVR